MKLRENMARSGGALFRWRSYLPLVFLPLFFLALREPGFAASEYLDHLWEGVCLTIAALGILVRALVAGHVPAHSSGRNTREQKAEVLNTGGLYSVVRHPLYLGNFFIWLGLALFPRNGSLAIAAALAFWLYYERIMLAEEEFLGAKFGASFDEWAARTPAIIPSLRLWTPWSLPFCWRTMLARENTTVFATTVMFFLLEVAADIAVGKAPHLDMGWGLLIGAELVAYLVIRWMKRRRLLLVPGR